MSAPQHTEITAVLADMIEFPGNPRNHGDKQLVELQRSLEMFGQYRPLVIDEQNQVLAGNGMLAAMNALGWETGKAVRIEGLSEAEKKKLVLADNRIATMGYTDFDEVDRILNEINDTQVPGYEEDFLRNMLASASEILEEANTYGQIDLDDLAPTLEADGVYVGENVPKHFTAEIEGEQLVRRGQPPVMVTAPPAPTEVLTTAAETITGESVQVCEACKRPW